MGEELEEALTLFKFELMWLKFEGFKELLQNWRLRCIVEGSASFILVQKLKHLKCFLKQWNKEVFENVVVKKAEALRQIALWAGEENLHTLSMEESGKREEARREFKSWAIAKAK